MSDLVGNPKDRFCHDTAHFRYINKRYVSIQEALAILYGCAGCSVPMLFSYYAQIGYSSGINDFIHMVNKTSVLPM